MAMRDIDQRPRRTCAPDELLQWGAGAWTALRSLAGGIGDPQYPRSRANAVAAHLHRIVSTADKDRR